MNNIFNPRELIFSLDIGTRSVIGTVGKIKDKKFEVLFECYKEHEERAMVDGQIHDINLVASVVKEVKESLEKEIGLTLNDVSIAAAGRFLRTVNCIGEIELDNNVEIHEEIVRSLELTAVKEGEKEVLAISDSKLYCVGYSVKEYYLNSYVISNLLGHKGEKIKAEVIATFLPRSVIDSLYSVMNKVSLKVVNLTLEPIAAIEAAVPKNLRLLNIALVDIGAGTSDIAISSREAITAYGMVPIAGDEITEIIAEECLVDFNLAESIKRKISKEEKVTYTDIIGLENTVESSKLLKVISPCVKKLADGISQEIIKLNGNKPPAAIFLVGGGAHTPGLIEEISKGINLPTQRIAIKDRTSVVDCLSDNELGSAGVTVLGIALSHIKRIGNDFIDVFLNDTPVSLFNSHKHSIMDVLLQGGVDPSKLISKNGKNIRFTLNGKKRLVFGEIGVNPKITLNRKKSTLETIVNAGDKIKIVYAINGKDASPKVSDVIDEVNTLTVYLDNSLLTLEPKIIINNKEKKLSTVIKNEDEVVVQLPNKVKDVKHLIGNEEIQLFREGKVLSDNAEVFEGDKLTSKIEEKLVEQKEEPKEYTTKVLINGMEVNIKGQSPVFIDIFNYIDIDITTITGEITLRLNGQDASYTDSLKNGDIIEVNFSTI